MRLYEIKNKPVRLISYLAIAPAGLIVFSLILIIYSTGHSVKCACNGFIDYWKDNNTPIRYDSIRQFVKYAIYGK